MTKLALLSVVLAATLLAAAPAPAALAPPSGPLRISYTGQGSRSFGACTVNPDGTNNVCLSNGFRPVAVPGGGDLYFVDFLDDTTTNSRAIYRMGNDGSDLRLVTFLPFSFGPISVDVAADGTRIVYDRYDGNSLFAVPHVYVANPDGTGERALTSGSIGMARPSFSPDGNTVVLFNCPTVPINNYGNICTIPTAGGTPKLIATNGDEPRWGRNGQIAFRDANTSHIMLMDGNGQFKIDTGLVGRSPALSPDGRQIAFTRMPPLSNVEHIWVANVDGSNLHEVAIGNDPAWFQGVTRATAAAPTVTVTAPTSGEIVGGRPVTFTWTASGNVTSQSIVLEETDPTLLNGRRDEPQNPDALSLGFTVVANLPGTARSFTWTPPASMNWTQRKVRVAATDSQGQVGVGLAGPVTTRPAPQVPPYVRVAYPDEPTQITWYTGGSGWTSFRNDDPDGISRVEVRLSLDGGATFPIVLAADTVWTTFLSFTVPDTPTTTARVRVTSWDMLGNSFSDVSDNDFTIARETTVVPSASLSSLALSPASVTGGATAQGSVTLSSAAPAGVAVVTLSSSSAFASVPATVTVPAGQTSASFTVATKAVTTSTAVTVTASYAGATRSATLTVAPTTSAQTDTVSVSRAEYSTGKQELRVEAASSNSTATLKVYVTSTGALIGMLTNVGAGKYSGQLKWPANPQNVTVKSSLGGSASRAVQLK